MGNFEIRLVEALQPIRFWTLAYALNCLFDTGAYDELAARPGQKTPDLAQRCGLEETRIDTLCRYLGNEDYVVYENGWHLSDRARAIAPFRAWYTLLVGGYSPTLGHLNHTLRSGAPWGNRNETCIGLGSSGVSMIDILPPSRRLLDIAASLAGEDLVIVDLGCGAGSLLCELVRYRGSFRGVGLERDLGSVRSAREHIKRAELSNRIDIFHAGVLDIDGVPLPDGAPCFVASFVLQEVLRQSGDGAVEALLSRSVERHPSAYWLVFEVDSCALDRHSVHGLARAYYNPYFLVHGVTEQRLESDKFWRTLFARVGLDTIAVDHPDRDVDSTDIEVGYLLRRYRT